MTVTGTIRLLASQSWVMPNLRPRIPFAAMRRGLSSAVRWIRSIRCPRALSTRTLRTEGVPAERDWLCCAVPLGAANADVDVLSQVMLQDHFTPCERTRRRRGARDRELRPAGS